MAFLLILGLVLGYLLFVAVRLGLHERLPLAFGPMALDDIPERAAGKYGERVLFTSDTECAWEIPALRERYPNLSEWSASRIHATAGYLAGMFKDRLRIERGEAVAVLKENHLDIHIFVTSIIRAGGIACPINGRFEAEKLHAYLLNLGARVLVSDSATVLRILMEGGTFGSINKIVLAEKTGPAFQAQHPQVEALLSSTQPGIELIYLEDALKHVREASSPIRRERDEPLYLVHSSGTTGFPKAVILKNGPQSHAVRGWLCYVHISRKVDRGYLAVPNNHQAVILTFNSLLLLGVRVHWTGPYGGDGFDAEQVVRELADGKFTGFFGFPITYTQLKEVPLEDFDLSSMRFWASTADALHEVAQRKLVQVGGAFRGLGLPLPGSIFLDAQGSSEVGTPSVIRYVTRFTKKFARRIGRPGSTPFGPNIRVTKPNGDRARRGEVGRLEVKGRTLFAGYWNQHALTLAAMPDRWFFTGDLVRRGMDGHLIQLDREVDVIRTRSGAVYTLPLEEKIHKHPAVFDACVYGARQADGKQLPAAAIALRDGVEITSNHLRAELNRLLTDNEQLHRLDILPWGEFPIGITGKTLKRVFRERSEPMMQPGASVLMSDESTAGGDPERFH